ncbi:hypothetical protein BZA70DRAFT_23599 [Myxozyma melibiosi]|uniref:Uncharacterized protein n=1 Tax=Myxozyma melibiosi TaxID=54550 RepID=A0ABR1FD22_9ASCO
MYRMRVVVLVICLNVFAISLFVFSSHPVSARIAKSTADFVVGSNDNLQAKVVEEPIFTPHVVTKTVSTDIQEPTPVPPSYCLDPYKRPGYFFNPRVKKGREIAGFIASRFVPYYDDLLEREPPRSAQYPPPEGYDPTRNAELMFTEAEIPGDILRFAPINWLQLVHDYLYWIVHTEDGPSETIHRHIGELWEQIKWMQHRRVLLLADSVDRYMIVHLCEDLGLEAEDYLTPIRTGGRCVIEPLNFTVYYWHVPSMYTSRPDWWFSELIENVPFENRTENLFMKAGIDDVLGENGVAPDLIIYQSLLWDWKANQIGYRVSKGMSPYTDKFARPLFWSELDFYRARQQMFIEYFRGLFGPDVPMMYRAVAPLRDGGAPEIGLRQLDAMARLVASNHDIEVFEWGYSLLGHPEVYKDKMHVINSPQASLFINMMFYYLHRSLGGTEERGQVTRTPEQFMSVPGRTAGDAWRECNMYNVKVSSH